LLDRCLLVRFPLFQQVVSILDEFPFYAGVQGRVLLPDDGFHAITIGYGLCGRGVAGIRARNLPLIIPRIHDCIAGFLGSHQRYMKEFSKTPGTYWFTRGFIQSGGQPGVPGKHRGISAKYNELYEEYERGRNAC